MRKCAFLLAILMFILPIRAAGSTEPAGGDSAGYIALTFDDGPSGAVTESFLEALEQKGASCTFFICGYRMQDFPTDLCAYAAHGHELGIHGWSHQYLRGLSEDELAVELDDTALMIEELAGIRPAWFRPPGGIYDDAVRAAAQRLELSIALWNVDPEDWNDHDSQQIVSRILSKVGDGDVVLMHDIFPASRNAALELVTALQQRGYQLVTLSELAAIKGSITDPGQVYSCFG